MAVSSDLPRSPASVGSRLQQIKFKPLMLMRSLGFQSEPGTLVRLKLASRTGGCRADFCAPGEFSLPSQTVTDMSTEYEGRGGIF